MKKNSILIAATGQNVGKTTLCLGIISGMRKRFQNVGFMKPVGQQHVQVSENLQVDKDVVLFKKRYSLNTDYQDMSPVLFPRGFTRQYLEGRFCTNDLQKKILQSYEKVSSQNDSTIVEGTGHVGVGSIVGLNNAKLASFLELDVVIIASGGLGSSYDELALNIAMCSQFGVKVRGIILNKVLDEKREMILEYFPKALRHWNIPMIGCIPYSHLLSKPTVQDFEALFKTTLLSGIKHRCRHFQQKRLVAGSSDSYVEEMIPNELIITPACREDIIQATLDQHEYSFKHEGVDYEGGMILTGKTPPTPEIIEKIKKVDIPVLYAPLCSYDAMKMITSFIAKIQIEDTTKVERAIHLVEKHVNFEALCH